MAPGLSIRVIFSYITDYIIVIGCIVGFTLLDKVEPYHQHFALSNTSIQFPYAVHERVPAQLAAFLVVLAPAVIILIWTLVFDGLFSHHKHSDEGRRFFGPHRFRERLWQLNCSILGLLLSVSAAITITAALKNVVGKPRPDLLDRCRPTPGSLDPPVFGLVTSAICTQTNNEILKDGFRSFPSGHSSTSFAGLGYLSLWAAGKLHVLDNRGEVWKTLVVLIPVLGASLIAASRIMDARHHGFDVLSGSLLGIVVAWAAYRQYFPPLHQTWKKGRAYPIRSWGKEPVPPKQPEPGDDYDPEGSSGEEDVQSRQLDRSKVYINDDIELGNQQQGSASKANRSLMSGASAQKGFSRGEHRDILDRRNVAQGPDTEAPSS